MLRQHDFVDLRSPTPSHQQKNVRTPSPNTHWFHFRVIKNSEEAPDQYHGDFYGLLLGMQDYDGRFLKSHDLEEGNLYKLKSGLTEGLDVIRYHAPRGVRDGTDYENIIFNLRPNRSDSWLRQMRIT